ncbi:lysostaphin resistance A-like protein [Nocardia sp. NPDC088792]|uniref:CPBP family intramembrane glutamic endopeptidase n=1 Tax=Nocardia sp. NPDC088792 TaxID=3364332 RepID=UPI003824ACAA
MIGYLAALVVLVCTGHTSVRFSADTAQTRPVWILWLPALAGGLFAWLVPPRMPARDPFAHNASGLLTRQLWLLVGVALAFAVTLHLAPRTQLWFLTLKFAWLLVIPLALRMVTFVEWARLNTNWLRAMPAVVAYILVATALEPGWRATIPDPVTIVVGFLVNAVLEEIFYRFWLQTRLESRYGRWPAIVVTSLLFAAWHSAIQGVDGLGVDLAAVVLNVGVTGLFLGYLWSRYRNPWLQVIVHGFINAPIAMFVAMA